MRNSINDKELIKIIIMLITMIALVIFIRMLY